MDGRKDGNIKEWKTGRLDGRKDDRIEAWMIEWKHG